MAIGSDPYFLIVIVKKIHQTKKEGKNMRLDTDDFLLSNGFGLDGHFFQYLRDGKDNHKKPGISVHGKSPAEEKNFVFI